MKLNKSGRTFRNYILFPEIQLKYSFLNAAIVTICLAIATFLLSIAASKAQTLADTDELRKALASMGNLLIAFNIFLTIAAGIFSFVVNIIITHRFVGPMVAIRRFLEDLQGKQKAKLILREHDALKPLADFMETIELEVKMTPKETPDQAHKKESGFTLLEVMMAMFILTIVLTGFMGSMKLFQTDIKRTQLITSRSDISSTLRMNLKEVASIFNSAEQTMNTELSSCLNKAAPCEHLTSFDLNLFSSVRSVASLNGDGTQKVDANGNPVYLAEPLSGISDTTCPTDPNAKFPVFYTKEGRRCECSEPADTCPLQAITQFQAFCPNGSPQCPIPQAIKVSYSIRSRPDISATGAQVSVGALAKQSGGYIVNMSDMNEDQQIRFSFASSYISSGASSGAKVVDATVTGYDISLGKALTYSVFPTWFSINAYFTSTLPVTYVALFKYAYPVGCDLSNIGTQTTINSVSVNCSMPTSSQFTQVSKMTLSTPQNSLTVKFDDSTNTANMTEYRLKTLDGASAVISESQVPLMTQFKQTDTLKITAMPSVLKAVCDSNSTYNTLSIQAKSFSGWKSITAKLDTQLTYLDDTGAVVKTYSLPGFETFNKDLTTVQSIVLNYKYFASLAGGSTIRLYLEGINNENALIKTDIAFMVGSSPAKTMVIDTPLTNSKVRTKYSMDIGTTMNLSCDDNPKLKTGVVVGVKEYNGGALVMNDIDISDSCVKIAGAVDENRYSCRKTFACNEWLGVTDTGQCVTKYPGDTTLTATAKYTTSTGQNLAAANNFVAGTKVTFFLHKNYVKFYLIKGAGLSIPAKTPAFITLTSPLVKDEVLRFQLTGSGNTQPFDCRYNGGGTATYNSGNLTCSFNLVTPPDGVVLTLEALDTDVFATVAPNVMTFAEISDANLSCANQPGVPICPDPQVLRSKYQAMGIYDFIPGNGIFSASTQLEGLPIGHPLNTLDAVVYYQPNATNPPDFSFVTSQKTEFEPGNFSEVLYHFPSNSTVACTSTQCPGDAVWFTSIDSEKLRASFGSSAFSIQIVNKAAGSGTAIGNASPEVFIVRQCYCQ